MSGVLLSWVLGEGGFLSGFGVFDFFHEELKGAVVVIYRFFSLHSSRCIRLFVPKTNNA